MKKVLFTFLVALITLMALFVEVSAAESERADYDLSGIEWKNTRFIYDAMPKCPELVGLPEGVTVLEYIGGGEISAGEYTVTARLSYDEEYNEPVTLECSYVIEKCSVEVPEFLPTVYNGQSQRPTVDGSVFSIEYSGDIVDAGIYPLTVRLVDSDNYAFVDGGAECLAEFAVLPRPVKIKVRDMNIHLFEKTASASWSVVDGSFLVGDAPQFTERITDGRIYLATENSNYAVSVVPGKINRLPYPTVNRSLLIFIPLVFGLSTAVFCIRRRKGKGERKLQNEPFSLPVEEELIIEENKEKTEENDVFLADCGFDFGFSVNASRADELITDSLAKHLVRRAGGGTFALHRKKCVINVDTISACFNAGDTVNLDALKEKKIVPSDSTYLKVLARGAMDKPLTVYADAFTPTAVKMIALTGGEAVKLTRLRGRSARK